MLPFPKNSIIPRPHFLPCVFKDEVTGKGVPALIQVLKSIFLCSISVLHPGSWDFESFKFDSSERYPSMTGPFLSSYFFSGIHIFAVIAA